LIAPALSVALLLGILAISGCSLSGVALPPSQREEAFQKALAIPIDPQLRLLTEKNRYSREDWIGIWAENKTRYVLRFKDQSLGLQAYQYGEQVEAWRLIDLGSVQGDPHLTIVTPGPRSLLPSDSIPADGIKASGTIRLVMVGTTEQGQQIAAYKDVEIMD
jgi:hypothetical protein